MRLAMKPRVSPPHAWRKISEAPNDGACSAPCSKCIEQRCAEGGWQVVGQSRNNQINSRPTPLCHQMFHPVSAAMHQIDSVAESSAEVGQVRIFQFNHKDFS